MPLGPRFRRVAALERRFVDREQPLAAFGAELARVGGGPRLLNVTGVGGIGKSRLLRELRAHAAPSHRTAVLDLQVPAMRQHEDALAVLRMDLGRQKVSFDRFDVAYAVLWQRLHPNLRISRQSLPFVEESEILTRVIDDVSGLPVFGTALGLIRLAEHAGTRIRRNRRTKADDVLQILDELDNSELLDAVTYLFADDLRTASRDKPYVLFVDAYEALNPATARARSGRAAAADGWLRDLVAQLDGGLTVIASREPLGWEEYDDDWRGIVRPCPIAGLPAAARLDLLADAGIADAAEQRTIAEASEGLPFYLHLAVDTASEAGPQPTVVSSEEIVQRFLHHVSPDEIRCLELLSLARTFDYDAFKRLTTAFDAPGNRMIWESLTAYSFVFPAGDGHRLHQLMATALARRLSAAVGRDAHRVLCALAEERGALREAVYHGVRAGSLDAAAVLDRADRALAGGGKQSFDGIVADLLELGDGAGADLEETTRCLATEAAVLVGDADLAHQTAVSGPRPRLLEPAGARLAIAAAHAQRIGGNTGEAVAMYADVWHGHPGPLRHSAGLWYADLGMWQGDFVGGFELCRQMLGAPDLDAGLRGDVVRLMHLGHRFHLDFADADDALRRARELYLQAGSVVGAANTLTNRVELLAWTDPDEALALAPGALDAQRELQALHELGKTHTAVAIAEARLGLADRAAGSFESAAGFLRRARYRSGMARAELFRGLAYGRTGDVRAAADRVAWAVAELVAVEVYPTLIVTADLALRRLGARDPAVSLAAATARGRLRPLDSRAALEGRIDVLVGAMLGDAG